MNRIKHKALFQMDSFNKLDIKTDSTISIIKEALTLGIKAYVSNPNDLTLTQNNAFVSFREVTLINSKFSFSKQKNSTITKFDYFFIRQDPPFDLKYLTNCYLLELHQKFNKNPRFINDPGGIKNFTEKICPIYFNSLMPKTLVTSDEKIFKETLSKKKTLILKTLYNKGGEGVIKVEKNDKNSLSKFKELISKYKVPVVIQDFVSKVSDGDKRVILIEGEPVGLINRVPKIGQYKANLHLGGKAEISVLTKKEQEICKKIKPFLLEKKLIFVGIDLIDEKLSEINVTSPTGIVQIKELTGVNVARILWSKLLKG
ncbi:MAG: glutathione synthase [Rickettsiales bacterium]|nr:glutathione synthase [Rickettsiales bacterium]OUT46782.1 MAG: glutathione synthase [Pelagibacteraceae bacterium TMED13]